MPAHAPASPRRWPWALVAVLVVLGVVLAWRGRGGPEGSSAKGAASAGAKGARAPRAVPVTARPRAGIRGRVLDPEDKPVPGAAVCAFFRGEKTLTTTEGTPRCVKADRGGEYALDDLFPATFISLTASAPRFAPARYRGADGAAELRLADGEQRAGVDLALRGGGVEVHGSVADATGGAVARAVVVGEEGLDRVVTASDDQGAFTLWVEPGPLHVQASASGYAPGSSRGPAPGHFFKIALVPGATLVGRAVIAGEETPVPGVLIDGLPMEGSATRASARTDEEGRFRIEGLAPGRYRVEAASEGREGYSKSSITLGLGETSAEVIVEMEPAFVVRGRVVDRASGQGCTGGRVLINDHSQSEYSEATIEPDGWARMASVIPGTYRVQVTCDGHVFSDDYPLVVVKDRDLPPLRWEVDKGGAVRVTLVDRQGQPVPKASVWAASPDIQGGGWAQVDHQETDGTYLLSGLKAGKYEVTARVGQAAPNEAQVTVGARGEEQVRIEVPTSGVIEGTVEDDAHRPVANVQVFAFGAGSASSNTLDDGSFTLTGLPSGEYEVRVNERRMPEPKEDPARSAKVTLAAPDHARVKLTVAAHAGVIEGRVIDGAGKPVTDGFIDYSATGSGVPRFSYNRAPVVTDTAGHFTVEGLSDGAYDLRAYRQGGSEGTVEQIKAGARDVVIKLADGGSIAGTVTAAGAPVERFNLSAHNSKTNLSRGEFFYHTAGAFSLADLPAGTYTLDAETPQGSATLDVALAEGEQKRGVTVALTLRQRVDGVLVALETGAPIAGAQLSVGGSGPLSAMNNDGHGNKTGSDGRFHLEGILPGSWSMQVSPPDPTYPYVQIPIVVPEGAPTTDVGAVRLPHSRLRAGEPNGMLGVFLAGDSFRAFGPASEAGIQNGDVIVSVDGYDVQGNNRYLFAPLTTVSSDRAVSFTLADGRTVSVTAR